MAEDIGSFAPIMISPIIHLVTGAEQNTPENNSGNSVSLSHATQSLLDTQVWDTNTATVLLGSEDGGGGDGRSRYSLATAPVSSAPSPAAVLPRLWLTT